jgi:hypothetical protein
MRVALSAGRGSEARAVVDELPNPIPPRLEAETANLFKAARFRMATSFDELLDASARTIVDRFYEKGQDAWPPVFDHDGAVVFSSRLPLAHLLQAARSNRLARRLRIRVATAGLARTIVVRDELAGVAFASTLKELQPSLQPELDRYINAATPDDRRFAAVLFLAHTPGATPYLSPFATEWSYIADQPRRTFSGGETWWCPSGDPSESERALTSGAGVIGALYQGAVPYPSFLSAADQATTQRQLRAVASAGPARNFIAAEAIRWAQLRPKDLQAAEALSIAVNGWRRGCGDAVKTDLPRRAFALLHRQFPNSEWAKKTKYWYE